MWPAGREGGTTNRPPIVCQVPKCDRKAIVYLSGRALCLEHYVENLNELNELGLTPRGLSEKATPGEDAPAERRVREPVNRPGRERARRDERR